MKLNYDGASKGNPRQAGARGIFRNSRGASYRGFAMDIGHETNNEAELSEVKQGLMIAKRENFQCLVVEGDSAMVIGVLKKLQQGTPWETISKIWRTTNLIREIGSLIQYIQYLIPSHVRRTGNEATDFLENWGSRNVYRQLDATPIDRTWDIELHPLQIIIDKYLVDHETLDRGAQ